MRALTAIFIGCVLLPSPGQAMNWEGHDDWMVDMEPALRLAGELPQAARKPSFQCAPETEARMVNPYEQIRLGRKEDCLPASKAPKAGR